MRAAFFIVSLFCCVTMDTGVFARLAGMAENFCLLTEQVSCETVVKRKKDSQQISFITVFADKQALVWRLWLQSWWFSSTQHRMTHTHKNKNSEVFVGIKQ